MKYVFVLEDDVKFEKEIVEAVFRINPKLQIRVFSELNEFVTWIKELMTNGKASLKVAGKKPDYVNLPVPSEGEDDFLELMITKVEFLGGTGLDLLRKTRQMFQLKDLIPKDRSTAFVLTAFEGANMKLASFEQDIISNVIFKPFDRLILREHIVYALEGNQAPGKEHEVALQKTKVDIEMLRTIKIEALSTLGFVTKSDNQNEIGQFSKFYGSNWTVEDKTFAYAFCVSSIPHPIEPDRYSHTYNFFDLHQQQISQLRKRVRSPNESPLAWKWQHSSTKEETYNFVVIDEEESVRGGLVDHLKQSYYATNVTHYNHFGAFLLDHDPNMALQQRDTSLRTLPTAVAEAELLFDANTKLFLGLTEAGKIIDILFGVTEADLKKMGSWFYNGLNESQKEIYNKALSGSGDLGNWDNVFTVAVRGEQYFVKVIFINRKGSQINIKIRDLTKDETLKYLRSNSRLPAKIHGLFFNDKSLGLAPLDRWKPILEQMEKNGCKPHIIILSKIQTTESQKKELKTIATDVLSKPVDRAYLNQKLKIWFKYMKKKGEDTELHAISVQEEIKIATPIKLEEISETGLVIEHSQDLGINCFREFVLWQPYKFGDPELKGKSNYSQEMKSTAPASEKDKNKEQAFQIQFVFFGITDIFLKRIRVWVRDLYISSKEAG